MAVSVDDICPDKKCATNPRDCVKDQNKGSFFFLSIENQSFPGKPLGKDKTTDKLKARSNSGPGVNTELQTQERYYDKYEFLTREVWYFVFVLEFVLTDNICNFRLKTTRLAFFTLAFLCVFKLKKIELRWQ